jgi:ankyrin repeat protein
MDEAARAALDSEYAALNARCAASSREAARVAATLRALPHAFKVDWLFNSAVKNNAALVRLLLADGLSPDSVDTDQSLLYSAVIHGSIDVVHLLLEAGADANSCDRLGITPLRHAVFQGQLVCARELIPHTDLLHINASGNNVLHSSIITKQPEIFKLLLPHFADNIDVRTIKELPPCDPDDPYDHTPLMLACQGGYHAIVKALLAAGASRTAHNSESFSCLHYAAQEGHLACVTMLIGRPKNQKMSPAEIDARDWMRRTPLFMAALTGHRYCCAALLAAGADPAATIPDGRTALDVARQYHPGNQELIELLECRGGGPAPLLCAGCGASDKRLSACSACGSASYCNAACLAQAWNTGTHKAECQRIQTENAEKARSRVHIHD